MKKNNNIKSLQDVAKIYKSKALQAINPGVPFKSYKTGTSKAYKTGNLYKQVADKNQTSQMFKYDKATEKYTLTFNISPGGADYGQYVHNGTRKMGKRPFAQIAAENPEVKVQIDKFVKEGIIQDKMVELFDEFDKKAKKAGLTVS